MSKPITPHQLAASAAELFPPAVFEAFNELITANWTGSQAVVKQAEVARLIAQKAQTSYDTVFQKGWLNVEEAFRDAGWEVEYNKRGYDETYESFFRFSRKP